MWINGRSVCVSVLFFSNLTAFCWLVLLFSATLSFPFWTFVCKCMLGHANTLSKTAQHSGQHSSVATVINYSQQSKQGLACLDQSFLPLWHKALSPVIAKLCVVLNKGHFDLSLVPKLTIASIYWACLPAFLAPMVPLFAVSLCSSSVAPPFYSLVVQPPL